MRNIFKRSLAVVLCLATLLSVVAILASCQKEEVKDMTVLVENGVASYKLVRPEKSTQNIVDLSMNLRKTITESCDCEMELVTDWVRKAEDIDATAKEILLGNTNRPESAEVIATLKPNSWAVVNKGNKIVICSNNDALLSLAVDWFIENCINKSEKTVKVEEKLIKTEGFDGGIPLSVGGASGYNIVYPKGNANLEYYASLFKRDIIGCTVVSDDKAEAINEIIIGTTSRGGQAAPTGEHEYSIVTEGSKIYINASDEDTLYYAVNYYIEYAMTIGDTIVTADADYNKSGSLVDYYGGKWELNLPYIEGGRLAPVFNLGPGLVNDQKADTPSDSYMHVVNNIDYTDFENYAKRLESFGFVKSYSANTDDNELWGFRLGQAYAYVHYSPREKFIRVILDKSSNCEVSDIGLSEELTGSATFYQYSIDLKGCDLVFVDNAKGWGMLYIIKLQDNSLILVDGGDNHSWTDNSLKGVTDFLYDITDTDKDTPLNIRLWYFTHPDDDHNGMTQPWINYLKNRGYEAPEINAVAFNYGYYKSNEGYNKSGTSYQMINYMTANYPDVKYIKIHTGMVLNIQECQMEVLGTIENMIGQNGKLTAGYDTNDTCSLVRFTIGGKKFFMCGDTSNHSEVQNLHLALYSNSYFKSDVNQIAHHGLNLLATLNRRINADYALVSYSYEGLKDAGHNYFVSLVGEKGLYYAGNFHTAFDITPNGMTVSKITRYDHPTGVLEDPNVW